MPEVVIDSQFFNNPASWALLESEYLPGLLSLRSTLRLCSAGCGSGKEPYGLALLLAQLSPGVEHEIIAVDADPRVLERARNGGPYTARDLRHVDEAMVGRYFEKTADDTYFIVPELRARVTFLLQDLRRQQPPGPFDLILFRDLETCFDDVTKRTLYDSFKASLRPRGYLFVGALDHAPSGEQGGFEPVAPSIYVRAGGSRS